MTAGGSSGTLSEPHIGFSGAETDSFGEVHNEFYATVMAMVGHDLRQPLQVIMSECDVLARSLSGSAERVHLTRIAYAVMEAASGLDRLIEAIRLHEASTRDRH